MKYLLAALLVCVMSIGCAVTSPTATTLSTNNNKVFYVIKSGPSKGGGPVGTVIAADNNGVIVPLGAFTGRSNSEQWIDVLTGSVSGIGNGALSGYFIGRGARQSGNTSVSQDQTATTLQNQVQYQGQSQAGGGE